jgi:acid phosphatase
MFTPFSEACGANASNKTDQLWIYEGGFPANGAAVQVQTVNVNGTIEDLPETDATSAAKKKGSGSTSAAVVGREVGLGIVVAAMMSVMSLIM